MAESELELVERAFVPWRAGRIHEFGEFLDPEVSWDVSDHPLPDFPNTGSGAQAFLGHMADYQSGWVKYEVSEIEAFDVDEEVMGQLGLQYGRA